MSVNISLLLLTFSSWINQLFGTPVLTSSATTVISGRPLTLTCTFPSQPGFLGMTFNSSLTGYTCAIKPGCSAVTGLCIGNTHSCSDNNKIYTLTLENVNDTLNAQNLFCHDVLNLLVISNEIQIFVLVPVSTVSIQQPDSTINVIQGSNVNLTCSADSSRPQSNITWYRNNVVITGTAQTVTSVGGDKYETMSILEVNGDRNLQGAQIYCSALNIQGQSPITSSTKTINVQYAPSGTPVLTPSNLTVTEGNDITLTCTLSQYGNPPATWSWTCEGRNVQQSQVTSSAGQSVLRFTSAKADNGRRCSCRAQSNIGSYDRTSSAVLNVQYAPSGTPVLTPSNPTVTEGNDITLTCTLTQYGNPAATWSWACEGRAIQQNQVTSNAGQSVLRFTSTKEDNGRRCSCRAQSNIGSYDRTSSVVLNVQYAPSGKPTFVNPVLTYNTSDTVVLTCTITSNGNPPAVWTWTCRTTTFSGSSVTNNGVQSTLTFTANKTYNSAQCTCRATSSIGPFNMSSDPVSLNIQFPPEGTPTFTNPVLLYNTSDMAELTCLLTSPGNPSARWTWRCGSQVFNQNQVTNTGSQSTVRFTVDKTYNAASCTCQATSSIGPFNEVSTQKVLNVQYPPDVVPSITANPVGLRYNDNTNVSLTCSSGGSNPIPTLSWNCNGLSKAEQTLSLVLSFTVNKTFNKKSCNCTATHIVENFRKSSTASLIVYYSADILSVNTSHQQPMEGNTYRLTAQVDGNPAPTVTWTNTDNNTLIKTDSESSTTRYLDFPGINCLDTALYTANASNGYGIATAKSVDVSVLCRPRLDDRIKQMKTIPVGKSKEMNFSLFSVSNPRPNITWIFNKDNLTVSSINGSDINITMLRKGRVEYHILLTRGGLDRNSFGNYIAQLQNSVGQINLTYKVVSEGPPDAPSRVAVSCTDNLATVRWTAEFNGGADQSFFIFSKQEHEANFSQSGGPYNHLIDKQNLSGTIPRTEGNWLFKVQSKNIFGETFSEKEVDCEINVQGGDSSALIAGVAGSVVVLIGIVAVVVGFIFLRLRNKRNMKGEEKRSVSTDALTDPSDGIKDNILYQSADDTLRKPKDNSYYKTDKDKGAPMGDLYATVDKSAKKAEKNKKAKGMVYENVSDIKETCFAGKKGDIGESNAANQERGYRNQDGLLYVDVELKPRNDGKRGVIIGEEDRTDYASVDFVDPNQ